MAEIYIVRVKYFGLPKEGFCVGPFRCEADAQAWVIEWRRNHPGGMRFNDEIIQLEHPKTGRRAPRWFGKAEAEKRNEIAASDRGGQPMRVIAAVHDVTDNMPLTAAELQHQKGEK